MKYLALLIIALCSIIVTESFSITITQFTTNIGYDANPTWSPDGLTIAYASSPNVILEQWWHNPTIEIYTKPLAGGEPTRLTNDNVVSEYPQYSPNGNEILFVTQADPTWAQKGIFAIPASGGSRRTVYDCYANDYAASWSPDGTKVVFISEREVSGHGGQRVWSVSSNGSGDGLQQLTFGMPGDWTPTYSPDGSKIAFCSSIRNGSPTVWVIPSSGGTPEIFVSPAWYPKYSPDGKWLSFLSDNGVAVMPVTGGDKILLFSVDVGVGDYCWSPDGTKIAFSSNYDIWIASNLPIINHPPIASDDSYNVKENTTLIIQPPGVLGNDSDIDGNNLTAIKVSDPSHGTLELNSDGSFTYIPEADYSGTDSFTYKVNDGIIDSNIATVTINVSMPISLNINLFTGWNGISCPGDPAISDWNTIIDGNPNVALIVEYDTVQNKFVIATNLEFGKSYFIGVTNSTQITLEYYPKGSLSLQMKAGWNPLGSLSGSILASNITTDPSGKLLIIVCWNCNTQLFEIASSIEPGIGYMAGCISDCNLSMDCLSLSPQFQRFATEPSWESIISVGTKSDHMNLVLGMNKSASDGADLYDRPIPPLLNMRGSINAGLVIKDSAFDLFERSYVREDSESSWKLSVELTENGEISWNNLPQAYSFTLVYDDHIVDMHTERSLSLPAGKHMLLVSAIPQLFIPERTRLLASYPNPCNPETWIPYELSNDTDVKIMIYSSNGNLVRSMELGHRPAGSYVERSKAAYWNGRNELGEKVSSGVYFYTLITHDSSQTRKLLIIQ